MEQLMRRKCKLRNYGTSKVEQFMRRKYRQKNNGTLEEGVWKIKNHQKLRNKDMLDYSNNKRRGI
jgi:hypothetical protein